MPPTPGIENCAKKVIGSPSEPKGHAGLPIHAGWPPNFVIGQSTGIEVG
ncbi:MAG: hypothetical protein ABJC24_07190 [Chloroflexota bacterium]